MKKDKLFGKLPIGRVRIHQRGSGLEINLTLPQFLNVASSNLQYPVYFFQVLLGRGFCEEAAGGGSGSKDDGSPSFRASMDKESRKRLQ